MSLSVKGTLQLLVWGFVVFVIITAPDRASAFLQDAWDLVAPAFLNLGRFLGNLIA
ncbi:MULTISPECIES: hypothetical protein [Ornithinimicrobium]|uniref:Uncharacterized protein n=2 Tax=Ornithinimicrobium TaxID=125287 RepID=A0ABV5V0N6_9MICO|nr:MULTISPECIES: hypothetical protein [Ornithinimicrobium]GGK78306.1 hypothetical protein GCM10011509_28540 [Ornithinimicrobium pekingense]